ncbi:MAG: sugar phosphate isomerase/epimerase [Chloroflexia bacterium]|nr:sugar phosphate isomerase/epimerase [Chloroflexia bacterium]
MPSLKLGVQTALLPGHDLAEQFANAAAYGYDGVEVNVGPAFDLGEHVAALKAAAQASGLPVCAICTHSMHDPLVPDPAERDRRFTSLALLLAQAEELGAAGVVSVPVRPPHVYTDLSWDEQADMAVAAFGEWAAGLPAGSSRVFLEPLNRYEAKFLNRVEQGAGLAARIDDARVSALADLFHMNIEEADLAAPIIAVGARLGHVHVADNNRLEPGAGCLDTATPLSALHRIGYTGFLTLECRLSGPAAEVLPASARYLRGLWPDD